MSQPSTTQVQIQKRFMQFHRSFVSFVFEYSKLHWEYLKNHHKYKAQNATIEIPNNPSKPDRYINSWTHQEWSRRSLAMLNEMGHDHSDVEWYLMLKENGWFA